VVTTVGVLEGKRAIVTGGGRGVGRGIALALAAEGASVAVCGRTLSALEETCERIAERGGKALAVICDITDAEQLRALVEAAVEAFGGIDILVNNAMQIPHGRLIDISEELIDGAWRSGPLAALRLMRLCHPYLRRGGVVVNMSSSVSVTPDSPLRGIYSATKAALNAISRAAASEWGSDGIRVNAIMPFSNSDAMSRFLAEEPEHAATVVGQVALGRIGDPEADIGRAAVFLCGPDASYITGVTLPVDGGKVYLR
jgi:meso-butanediol dehydrogenase / (S,S)-butanediol dehydrogenase / diacetyl reductase